jgi:regulator of protease activity HflC (stomatin/prohibitin superfamily)
MLRSLLADNDGSRQPYHAVLLVLLASAIGGAICTVIALFFVDNPLFADVAVALVIGAGCVFGIIRAGRPTSTSRPPNIGKEPLGEPIRLDWVSRVRHWIDRRGDIGTLSTRVGAVGVVAILLALTRDTRYGALSPVQALIGAAACGFGAVLAVTVVHYLQEIDVTTFPESRALARAGRVLAWLFIAAGVSMGLLWAEQLSIVRVLHSAAILVYVAACYGLLTAISSHDAGPQRFPIDLDVFSVLGARHNILGSVLDSAERQLGIDLRSTWALAFVRQSLEPLLIALCVVGWLSTSLTVVGVDEQGLLERLGVPVTGDPLPPGIHAHWPWPIDRVLRMPVLKVQALGVGHEGEERGGPEDVLWARQHAENEYTLLLGNGRDLITIDAAVQFRIADPKAWHYNSKNPGDALKAIAYRAVMRTTVNRTLTEALSENVVVTTATMRGMVQRDADALGLGVEVLDFTIGGMHPPVLVASAYQAVVSAELGKTTAVVNAQTFRNQTVPAAESNAVTSLNSARADGAAALAHATGESAAFVILQSQYRAAPEDYTFRRRLETLEQALAKRRFTIVDARFQQDGGELWVRP